MPPLTVGELQVILSGDTSRLDRDMDRLDNRAAKTEKIHTTAWTRTGITAGEALAAGVGAGVDKLTRDAQGKLRNARGQFATEAEILAAGMQPAFRKGGEDGGGILAKGMRSGLIRNSPLIAAAIGGALIAGAPLIMAGAAVMFAGVGAAAAAQTVEVRSAWTQLGKDIRDGAVADSAVLVPVYVDMAEQIGDAFEDMRPQLREAFADSAPLIQSTTDGVIALGQNAMPGLVRAIAAGGPVFDGLEHFLATVGTGVTDFFDAISGHSPAAGTAFASLGDILGDLLPILGELLGQGAELAADVLPAVAAATGVTLDVLQLLGPLLPGIVTGFVAFKAAQTAATYLQTFAVQAQYATIAMTGSVTAGAKVGGVLSGLGRSLPGIAIGVAVLGAAMERGEQQAHEWGQALLDGGAAAEVAMNNAAKEGVIEAIAGKIGGLGEVLSLWTTSSEEAAAAADELYAAMNPLQQAQQDVTKATNELLEAQERYGPESDEAAAAAARLAREQAILEGRQGTLELAIHGVTSAMIEQADQALAAIDSGFAYRKAIDDLEDAQGDLNIAIAEQGVNSETAQRAQLALEQQAYNTALAFGQQQADLSGLSADSQEYKRIVQEEMLGELQRLRDAAGPEMKAAYEQQISALRAGGVALTATSVSAGELTGRMRDLGLSVQEIPGSKFIKVDAPTEEQKQRLRDLGYTVTNIPGSKNVIVTADTSPASAALAALVARSYTIQVRAVMPDLNGAVSGSGRMGSFDSGGYTGGMGVKQVAGIVHGREFVVDADKTARWRPVLEAIHAGNEQAAAMLAATIGGGSSGGGVRVGGSAGTGSASVGGVTQKHYHLNAAVRTEITPREFVALQREADALYG